MDEEIKLLAHNIVEKIRETVKQASLHEFYRFGTSIGVGADGTPTKYIDKIAEDVAVTMMEDSKVNVNLLSEEIGFVDFDGKYTFVLDPVDGTRNAYRGIPFYAVSLAIGTSKLSDVEYGIVKNIPTGDIFTAEKQVGAFYNGRQIRVCDVPSQDMVSSLALGKNISSKTLPLSKKHNVRSLGSCSLEMCMVAIGALDFYVAGKEYIRIIDLAASTLIVREAGGFVTNIHGEALEMDFNLAERTSVVAACTEELIQSIIS
jgi:fructose-1,6-bisphosphatase/inositol monophosphatase family enzyme